MGELESNKDKKKEADMGAIEDQVADIMKGADVKGLEESGISEDVRERVESAALSEIDTLEEDLGIDTTDELSDLNWVEEPRRKIRPQPKKQPEEVTEEQEAVDGQFKISVSEDRMNASVDMHPSKGKGVPLGYEAVKKRLDAMGIVYGINHDLIKKLIERIEESKVEKKGVIIAQGSVPTEGKDGGIVYSFSESKDALNEDSKVAE